MPTPDPAPSFRCMPFIATEPLGMVAWAFVALQVLLAYAAWRSRAALVGGEKLPPPRVLYPVVALQLLVLLGLALAAAWDAGIALRPPGHSWERALIYGPLALALLLASVLPVWRFTPAAERARRTALLPRDTVETSLVLLVCLIAGVAEEIAYRAVLPGLLQRLTGSLEAALLLSAVAFALAHWVQGKLAMAVVLGFAIAFHALVALTGGLAAAIAVHALYDALVSTWLGPRLHRRAAG